MKPWALALAVSLLTLLGAPQISAQDADKVTLTIRLASDSTRFHVGEIIPIELSFSTSEPGAFICSSSDHDMLVRLGLEVFHVTPAARDPLEHYLPPADFPRDGIGEDIKLSDAPFTIEEDLNEYVAIDQPGHYSVYLTSTRVTPVEHPKDRLALQSNLLEFEVIPADPAWVQQTLTYALNTLDANSPPDPAASSDNSQSSARGSQTALRTLRYLETPQSIHAMVRSLGRSQPTINTRWFETAALAGYRDQALVVRELEQQVPAPDMVISHDYISILANLKLDLENSPLQSRADNDSEQKKIIAARSKRYFELTDALYRQTADLLPTKQGRARAESLYTLLVRDNDFIAKSHPLSGYAAQILAEEFPKLSPEQQFWLLHIHWKGMKTPAMVAPLVKLAQSSNMENLGLRDLVFSRLIDLDLSAATPVFLEEIRNPHLDGSRPGVRPATFDLLPQEALPQFDSLLASRLTQYGNLSGVDSHLIGRFGTKAIFFQVKAAYENAPADKRCKIEGGLLAYLLRYEPDYAVNQLKVARGCAYDAFPTLLKIHRWKEVEPSVIAELNAPNTGRVSDAAHALSRYGDARAEQALWDRLRRFHAQWGENEREFSGRMDSPVEQLERDLVRALIEGQSWLLTNEQIDQLRSVTIGDEALRDLGHWKSPVYLNLEFVAGQWEGRVGQSRHIGLKLVCAKLAQYPAGTAFTFEIEGPPDQIDAARSALFDTAATHSLQINESSTDN